MKIGMFSDRYLPQTDGVAYSIETFRIQLERLGHEVYIIAPASGLRVKETNKHVIRFRAVKGLLGEYDYMTSLFFPPAVTRQLDDIGLDVIHYHTPGQVGLLGAYYALHHNIPLVTTYHTDLYEYVKHYPGVLPGILALSMMTPIITGGGMDDFRVGLSLTKPERSVDRWNQKIVRRGVTLLHNHCDLVIAPSQKMLHQLTTWKTQAPMAVLQTGVDELITTKTETAATLAQYGLTPEHEIILSVGRVGPEKNLDLLIKAFTLVHSKRPQTRLLIVGDGAAHADLIELAAAEQLGHNAIFAGRVDRPKLGSIYRAAKVFAFPSLSDTQGLVVNEAALAGVPVVMCDHGVSEVMVDRQTGLFAKPTPTDMAAKLIKLLEDDELRRRLGNGARAGAEAYSASAQAAKLLRLYQEVIEHHRERAKQINR